MSAATAVPAVVVAAPAVAKPKYVIRKATVPRPLPKGPPPSRARASSIAPASPTPVLITPAGPRAGSSPGRRDGEPMVMRAEQKNLSASSRASTGGDTVKERDKDTWKRMSAFLRGKDVEDALAAEKEAEKSKKDKKDTKDPGKKGGLFGKLGKSLLGDKKHEDGAAPETPVPPTSAPVAAQAARSSSPAPHSSGSGSPSSSAPSAPQSSIFPSSASGSNISGTSSATTSSIFPSSSGSGSGGAGSSIFPSSTGGSIFPSSTGASIFPTITTNPSAASGSGGSAAPSAAPASSDPVPPDDKDLSPEEVTNRAFKRSKVREEMLETEKDYVQDLDCIVNVFLRPLQVSTIIDKKDVVGIFSNIETIYEVNSQLFKLFATQAIGQAFLSMADGFKSYSTFMGNQNLSAATLDKLKPNAEFQQFLTAGLNSPLCRSSNIDNMLIKPMQRICKYGLLLDQLAKYTPGSEPDYPRLLIAKKAIEAVCDYIDASMNEYVNTVKMKEIEMFITWETPFTFITPSRKYIREGDVKTVQGGETKQLHLFLFDDLLVLARPSGGLLNNQSKKKYRARDPIPLSELLLKDISSVHLQLTHVGVRQYTIVHDNPFQKDQWRADIEGRVDELLQKGYLDIYGRMPESERIPFASYKKRMQTQLEFIPLPETKASKGKAPAPASLKQNNVIDLGSVTRALPTPPSAAAASASHSASRPASGGNVVATAPEDYNYEDDY